MSAALRTAITLVSKYGRLNPAPTHAVFCWDGEAKRDKHRAKKHPEYLKGIPLVAELSKKLLGVEQCWPAGEADDAVATIAMRSARLDKVAQVFVASGDKDLHQLIGDKIAYYSLNEKSILTWSYVCAKWNVTHPSYVAIALAVIGDASDAIGGIKGWGPKKVKKLFDRVPEGASLVEAAEIVSEGMNQNQLAEFEESLNLTLLDTAIPNLPDPTPVSVENLGLLENYPGLAGIRAALNLELGASSTVVDEI